MKRLLPLLLLAFLVGCATNWQTTAGKALGTTAQTVDAAMKGWATYAVAAKLTDAQQAPVKAAYAQYQAAMNTALVAYGSAVSANDQTLAGQASAALVASQQTLVSLIASLTQKPASSP